MKWIGLLAFALAGSPLAAETLEQVLQSAAVPTLRFNALELSSNITSYAIEKGQVFLLAYYVDEGSGMLQPPLYVIRYDRPTHNLRRAEFRDKFLGSALIIREYKGSIFVGMHYNPSAGCVLVLSSDLVFRMTFSGWLLELIGDEYAIVRGSEVHFMSVHPIHIAVLDLKRNRAVEVYPFDPDPERKGFSRELRQKLSEKWCMDFAAQCDPENFNVDIGGRVAVNEAEKVFGFEAQFSAGGFGDVAMKTVQPRTVIYIFRERGGTWEHREFELRQFERLAHGRNLQEFITYGPIQW